MIIAHLTCVAIPFWSTGLDLLNHDFFDSIGSPKGGMSLEIEVVEALEALLFWLDLVKTVAIFAENNAKTNKGTR